MIKGFVFLIATFTVVLLFTRCQNAEHAEHAEHEGDEHAGPHTEQSETEHAAEKSDDHALDVKGEHDDEEESEINITPEAMKLAGIALATVGIGKINTLIDLSGEVGFNEDQLVHITPRFSGIAKEARFRIGEYVKAGETVAVIESNESMTHYSLKAPISGRIIEKHIAPGEHVSEEESVYMLADLSSVWVNVSVYPKDVEKVKKGQNVSISAVGSDLTAQGVIQYVTPVVDIQTRTITARVVLPNSGGVWRPGTFVRAHITISGEENMLVVDKDAVQILANKTVVFIEHEPNFFKPVQVTVGESDSEKIRIISGLDAGVQYVSKGSFELKAKIVTSSLGEHAGHGH